MREVPGLDGKPVRILGDLLLKTIRNRLLDLFLLFPQTERPHVCPSFLDIGQTLQGIEGDWEYLRS